MSNTCTLCDDNDNIYINVTIYGGSEVNFTNTPDQPSTGKFNTICRYNVTKDQPILNNCSEYYASVLRFDIPLQNIPLYIMPIVPNTVVPEIFPVGQPNLTPLIIGIKLGNVPFSQNLKYVNFNSLSPPLQNQLTQVITPYYFCYSFQILIDMINTALAACHANFFSSNPTVLPPFLYLDPATSLLNLVVDILYTGLSPPYPYPVIYMNTLMFNYLSSFSNIYIGENQPNGMDYILKLFNFGPYPIYPTNNQVYNYNYTTTIPSNTDPPVSYSTGGIYTYNYDVSNPSIIPIYYRYTQEYSSLEYWYSLRRILLTTNSIPISKQYTNTQNNQSSASSVPILTDFNVPIEYIGSPRSIAFYLPESQYRLIDMISHTPLRTIDLNVSWVDTNGNIYDLFIPYGQQASVKIGFFKKNLYKNTNNLLTKK